MSEHERPLRPQLEELKRRLRLHVAAWHDSEGTRGLPWASLLERTAGLFDLAIRMQLDERVPREERERLLAALLYVAAPGDLLPEQVLGADGYRDDLLVLALALARAFARVPGELVAEHWQGDGDVRELIGHIISHGEVIAGETLWPHIMEWVDR